MDTKNMFKGNQLGQGDDSVKNYIPRLSDNRIVYQGTTEVATKIGLECGTTYNALGNQLYNGGEDLKYKDSSESQEGKQSKMIDAIATLVLSGKSYNEAYKEVTSELINNSDDALMIEYIHYAKEEVLSKVKIISDKLVDKSIKDWNNNNIKELL